MFTAIAQMVQQINQTFSLCGCDSASLFSKEQNNSRMSYGSQKTTKLLQKCNIGTKLYSGTSLQSPTMYLAPAHLHQILVHLLSSGIYSFSKLLTMVYFVCQD
jgi:hypothetical protein